MKSFIYTLMFLVSLAVVSCAKQDVRPTGNVDASDAPVWRSSETGETHVGDGGVVVEGAGILDPNDNEGVTDEGVVDIDGNGILDPNDDKGKRKIKE